MGTMAMRRYTAWLPTASGILFAVLLFVVDPLMGATPWWTMPDLWLPLAFPLLVWLVIAGVMAWLGSATRSWLHALHFSFISFGAGVIPALLWTLLLFDAFPDSGSPQLSLTLSLVSCAAVMLLGLCALVAAIFGRISDPWANGLGRSE